MSFFYTISGDDMKIYLDLLFFLNFSFDFILLLSTSILLRRKASINRILVASFIGGLSILFLFIKISTLELLIYKFLVSLLMILISFGFRTIKYTLKNLGYLYVTSILLGGFIHFLNTEFSYKNEGIVFYHNGLSINYIFIIIFSPVILYIYIKQGLNLKNNYSKYHNVTLYIKDQKIKLSAFLDTGNTLVDPYMKRPVILINRRKLHIDINEFGMILVPYKTISGSSILKCISANKIIIGEKEINKKFLVGITEEEIKMDGIDLILNEKIMEE